MQQAFTTTVDHRNRKVKVSLGSKILTFPVVRKALIQVKNYLEKNFLNRYAIYEHYRKFLFELHRT